LPLEIFIDCLIDNDLSGLGTGSELQDIWNKIYTQSLELSQDGSYNEAFEIMKEIDDVRAKITIANAAIDYLQMSFDDEIVAVLNSFALQCNLKAEDTGSTIISKLNAVIARMKKWFPKLTRLQADLDKLRSSSVGKINRGYFDNWLDAMSQEFGYHVKATDITVSRFYRNVAKINAAAIKKQQEATKTKR
jgi:hypothetical protein